MNVNIANIPMPTAEERAEMRALDAKLDALAKLLKTQTPGAGVSRTFGSKLRQAVANEVIS